MSGLAEERLEFKMFHIKFPVEYGNIYLKGKLIAELFILERTSANNKERTTYLFYKARKYLKFHSRITHYLMSEYKVGSVVKAIQFEE